MTDVEENTTIIKVQKKRGRKPHLNADGLPLSVEEKYNEPETEQTTIMKIIMNTESFKKHVGFKEKR